MRRRREDSEEKEKRNTSVVPHLCLVCMHVSLYQRTEEFSINLDFTVCEIGSFGVVYINSR